MKASIVRTRTAFTVVVLACFISASPAHAQQQKIGYVNSETILKELPEAKDAKEKLAAIVKGWNDEIEKMSKDLQDKYEDYQKKQGLYNEQTKQSEQKKLIDQEQKMNEYRQQKFGQQGELALQQDKVMQPIKEKVFKAIEQVAKEQKLSFVFDKAGDVLLLYADKGADYTFIVIDRLKRGSK